MVVVGGKSTGRKVVKVVDLGKPIAGKNEKRSSDRQRGGKRGKRGVSTNELDGNKPFS